MARKYVSWRRVSTFKQNRSGLGLAAQKEIIRYFVEREEGELIADYSECYTGKDLNGCVELHKAMAHAKREDAVLIIAKSDRFRNCQEALSILDEMGEGNIEFCDIPHTDRFTLTLFFALAEREALIISIRTKQALEAKKAKGGKLGGQCEKWRESYENKSVEEKHEEQMKRGKTKNERYLQSRDVQVFVRILKSVFVGACKGELVDWLWKDINTKEVNRVRVLSLMKDYKDTDTEGTLFAKWNLEDVDDRSLQTKLANYINSLKRAALNEMRLTE